MGSQPDGWAGSSPLCPLSLHPPCDYMFVYLLPLGTSLEYQPQEGTSSLPCRQRCPRPNTVPGT